MEGVVEAMFLTQLETATAVLLALGVTAFARGAPPDPLPAGAVAQLGSIRLQDFTIDRAAAFSPDGKLLASAGANTVIRIWDVASGAQARTCPNHGSVYDLRWGPDGRLAALTHLWNDVFLMQGFGQGIPDLTQQQLQRHIDEAARRDRQAGRNGRQDHLYHCCLSADGRRVVAVWNRGSKNSRQARLYRFASGQTSDTAKVERELDIPGGYGIWLSGDGNTLLVHVQPAVGQSNRLHAFDLTASKDREKPAWELTFPGVEHERRPEMCFCPDGKRVVILFWDDRVELWDGPSGKRLRELGRLPKYYHHASGEWGGIDLSPDGKRLALIERAPTGEVGGRVLDVQTGRDVCRLAPRPLPRSHGRACLSPDGKRVARAGSGVVALWDAQTGADLCPLPGHRGEVNSLAVLGDGKQVVTGGDDLTARAWRPDTGKEVWRVVFPQLMDVRFILRDGTVLLQQHATWGNNLLVQCLDAATGKNRPLPGPLARTKEDMFLACSPDGKRILTLDMGKRAAFRLWSWPAGELQAALPIISPGQLGLTFCGAAHFSADGKHFAAVMYYSDPIQPGAISRPPDHPFVETWDAVAGRRINRTALGHRDFHGLMPYAGGLYFWDKDSVVREAVTGAALGKLHIPEERRLLYYRINAAALSPDGRTLALALGFNDQQLLLFEVRTGRLRAALPVPGQSVRDLSFLPDGQLVSLGTTATVWSVALQPAAGADKDLEREWQRLGDPEPAKAWPAMQKLARAEAVDFIRRRVRAIPRLSDAAMRRIFRDLDADEYEIREAASKDLERLGVLAVPRVRAVAAGNVSLELKRRLAGFLAHHDRLELAADELRALRAVEVLEAIATPAARKLLGELAGGEPDARLTRDAAGAVRRAGQR